MQASLTLLPDLSQVFPVTTEQVASYQQNGHIKLRQVATRAEVAAFQPIISQAADKYNTETRALDQRDTYGKAFLQVMNLWRQAENVARFVLAHRFGDVAAQLLGVPSVRLYHDQALFKEAGGGQTPWHQDQYYWPLDTDKTITLWMPLTDISVEMGPMIFVNGSHKFGYLGKLPISDQSQNLFEQFIQERGLSLSVPTAMAAGDATFHSGWTLHSAGANSTNQMREVMTVIYFADGTQVTEPDNRNRAADLAQWLPGCKPGELAASPLNPIL